VPVASPAQNHCNLLPGLLTESPATTGSGSPTNFLPPREVDHEVIAVELHYPADQIGTYVVAAGSAPFYVRSGRHNHADRQSAIASKSQVLTEKSDILGALRLSRESVFIPKHTAGWMYKILLRAVEHHSSVSCHRGKAADPIAGRRAESAKCVDQGEIHSIEALQYARCGSNERACVSSQQPRATAESDTHAPRSRSTRGEIWQPRE
jgi:hypothetical protein